MTKNSYTAEQRFSILLETTTFSETQLSEYCRRKGIYPEQIKQWNKILFKMTRNR